MRAVNLLPRDDRRASSRQQNPAVIGGVAGAVAMAAILAAWFLTASAGVAENQKRFDAVQAELAATPVPPPNAPGASQLEQEKSARIAALSTVLAGRLAWDRVLRELSLVLPDDVWLTSLSAQVPSGGTGPSGLAITGSTYSHDGVARLLTRLAVVPQLSDVQLQHSAVSTTETGRSIVEFQINAVVKTPGAV